ncbi:hypothetical protein [Morganella morganii]|uniref:hypothetical protein n=1 Tax=Morganella morganii TaxID=582 RepID=UPI0020253B9E|nr:hypothetical protein [Morganella morganii]
MKTKQTKMELIHYEKGKDKKSKKYMVSHDNGKTKLEQELTVTCDLFVSRGLKVEIAMDDFPRFDNETEAVLKYADWLERLGIALRREAKRAIKRGIP